MPRNERQPDDGLSDADDGRLTIVGHDKTISLRWSGGPSRNSRRRCQLFNRLPRNRRVSVKYCALSLYLRGVVFAFFLYVCSVDGGAEVGNNGGGHETAAETGGGTSSSSSASVGQRPVTETCRSYGRGVLRNATAAGPSGGYISGVLHQSAVGGSGVATAAAAATADVVGTPGCPWVIEAMAGQRVNLTLLDFVQRRSSPDGPQWSSQRFRNSEYPLGRDMTQFISPLIRSYVSVTERGGFDRLVFCVRCCVSESMRHAYTLVFVKLVARRVSCHG